MGTGVANQVRVPTVTPPAEPGRGVDGTEDIAEAEADVDGDAVLTPAAVGVRCAPGECTVPHAVRRRRAAQHAAMPE
ncbi:MAG: hypothetical protein ABSB36_11190 [Candidatus Dormibacteria bacterium]